MNSKGQFSIIAALLVAVILISTVIVTYSTIRNSPIPAQPQVLSAIDETNFAIKQILGFTVGYYGSVLKVTGNSSYAKMLATNYLHSGFENIANMHPEWGTSFNVSKIDMRIYWFTNTSYSIGNLAVKYSLTGLGIYGINYTTSCKLSIQIIKTNSTTQACLNVAKDEKNEPLINLGKQNFKFYRYIYENSTWKPVSPLNDTSIEAHADGTYYVNMSDPALLGIIDPYSYLIQVEDPRGIIVVASSFSRYTCTLNWSDTFYAPLKNAADATIVVELLQNGTMQWLGQNLNLTSQTKPIPPIPPIPVKAIRVNQTINGVNREVPFQIEDWASDYKIPLGLTSNASLFNSRTMLVFLINPNVSKVTIWWNGSDTATQTPLAYTNKYFTVDTSKKTLNNKIITVKIDSKDNLPFKVVSTKGQSSATAVFMRINGENASFGWSEPMYAITNGPVRVVLQHEVEWEGNGAPNCPNVYAHIVLTLPANATYYTYHLRLMFLNSTDRPRTITDLCPIKITTTSSATFSPVTEDGVAANGYPNVSTASGLFYNMSNIWAHHWTQLNSTKTRGFGIMFPDDSNKKLYYFDSIIGDKTGALNVSSARKTIAFSPVKRVQVSNFASSLDICWYGAVVTFDGTTPIYKIQDGKKTGLWVIVEYPPTITVTTQS